MTEEARRSNTSQPERANNPATMDAKRTSALKRAVILAIASVVLSLLAMFFMDAPPKVSEKVWRVVRAGYVAVACGYLAMHLWLLRQHLRSTRERETMTRRRHQEMQK